MPELKQLLADNQANWDERVQLHLDPANLMYDVSALKAGTETLDILEEKELGEFFGSLAGKRVLHLQCHFGMDTLILAQRGAEVVGVDFSSKAIATARTLADACGLAGRSRFVECNLYDAPQAVGEPAAFDLVYATWGALCWLHDIAAWGRVVAHFLRPGGAAYIADGHPSASVFDDQGEGGHGTWPGWLVPYFSTEPITFDESEDYANPTVPLQNCRQHAWQHTLSGIVMALISQGLSLRMLREHPAITWQMFSCLMKDQDGMYRWPDKPWLPLAFSLVAEKPA